MDVFELLRCVLIPGFLIAVIGLGYFFKKSRDLQGQIDRDPHVWNVACDHAINELMREVVFMDELGPPPRTLGRAALQEDNPLVIKHEIGHVLLSRRNLNGCFFCNEEDLDD